MERHLPERTALAGTRVLVVEDDAIIALELGTILGEAGATVLGPCRNVRAALDAMTEGCDVAILDLRLGHEHAGPIAAALERIGTPFLFYTGQSESDPLLREWPGARVIGKPASPGALVSALAKLLRD